MIIKICGPGCANCEKTRQIVAAAVAAKGVGAAIEKVKDFQEMAMMGVFSTPAVVINGEVRASAPKYPNQAKLKTDLVGVRCKSE